MGVFCFEYSTILPYSKQYFISQTLVCSFAPKGTLNGMPTRKIPKPYHSQTDLNSKLVTSLSAIYKLNQTLLLTHYFDLVKLPDSNIVIPDPKITEKIITIIKGNFICQKPKLTIESLIFRTEKTIIINTNNKAPIVFLCCPMITST